MLNTVIIVIDVIAALFLILTILLHSGRGAACPTCSGHLVAVRRHRLGADARQADRRLRA